MPSPAAVRILALLAAAGLTVTVAACGTPPQAVTPPAPPPTFTGVSVFSQDHSVMLREVAVLPPGGAGLTAGTSAPLTAQVWNNTNAPVTLTGATAVGAALVLVGASATPTPALDVVVPGGATVTLAPEVGRYLQVRCLPVAAPIGSTLSMTFRFSNGATITTDVPVGAYGPASTAAAPSGASTGPVSG